MTAARRLDYESGRAALVDACEIVFDASTDALDFPIPTCPGWRMVDLVQHLGDVFTFWRTQLEAASPESRTQPPSRGVAPGTDIRVWFEDAADQLDVALGNRDPDEPCWNWSGADLTAEWVGRRMALESAVHSYDAELSIGKPGPLGRDLAVDGIDEWLRVHLATELPETPAASLGGVLCLACADDPAAWTVEVSGGRLRWREGRGPADAVLVGTASDLYLYGWNRRGLEVLDLTGSHDVAAAWSTLSN